jgi:hypothetical protein
MARYLPAVAAAAGPGGRRTYGSYRARMATVWGDRPLDDVAASDIEALQRQLTATARRAQGRGGRHARRWHSVAGHHRALSAECLLHRDRLHGRRLVSIRRTGIYPMPTPSRWPVF